MECRGSVGLYGPFKRRSDVNHGRTVVVKSKINKLSTKVHLRDLKFSAAVIRGLSTPNNQTCIHHVSNFAFSVKPAMVAIPRFVRRLFSLRHSRTSLASRSFPSAVISRGGHVGRNVSNNPDADHCIRLVPVLPFCHVCFSSNACFSCSNSSTRAHRRVRSLNRPNSLRNCRRFRTRSGTVFRQNFLRLNCARFNAINSVLGITPSLLQLSTIHGLFHFDDHCFGDRGLHRIFAFRPLLINNGPLSIPTVCTVVRFMRGA